MEWQPYLFHIDNLKRKIFWSLFYQVEQGQDSPTLVEGYLQIEKKGYFGKQFKVDV